MNQEEILILIDKISPHAKDYVNYAFEKDKVEIPYSIFSEENKGVFIKVDNDDCCIFYASFINENNIEPVLEVINSKTKEYIGNSNSKEICFNVYGNNTKIISFVRALGFKVDMEGYHLEYNRESLPQFEESNLTEKGYDEGMLEAFVDLFDNAYYQLNLDNNWKVNSYASNKAWFHRKLNDLNKNNEVCSFWINNELAGAYIFEKNYITDIVVKPVLQNKGYGSYILSHCIGNMTKNKSIKNIRLRVAKSNSGAKKLYERNGFTEIACFAEHTY